MDHAPDPGAGHDLPHRTRLRELAEEQAALRRVATLVARGIDPVEIFSAVAEEAGRLLQVGQTNMIRYESDLREIARGIHPAIFSEGGLGPALRTLARRAAIAVERVPASR